MENEKKSIDPATLRGNIAAAQAHFASRDERPAMKPELLERMQSELPPAELLDDVIRRERQLNGSSD